MKKFLVFFLLLLSWSVYSQTDTTKTPLLLEEDEPSKSKKSSVVLSGYIEPYYSYDFANPSNHTQPNFIYSFNRTNEVNINLGFIKCAVEKQKIRGNIALMTGTYANANLATEPGVLKNIYEANAGFKLSKKKNLWLDAGVLSSHIGFESAIGKDCWNLTRSMLADNSPYYESGAKVSYTTSDEKWFVSGLFLNGWQRIQRQDANNTPAFGHQVTFRPNGKTVFNSSSFIGSTTPDSVRQMRYFHDFYWQSELSDKLSTIIGFDIGAQQSSKGSNNYNFWYSPIIILKYCLSEKINIAARGEYYSDKNQVIIQTGTQGGFQTYGYSINLDYHVIEELVWRVEARGLRSKDKIFTLNDLSSNNYYSLTTSFAILF